MGALAFDVEKFRATLKAKGVIVSNSQLADSGGDCFRTINGRLKANKAYHLGYRDHINGKLPIYPDNTYYMIGYNDYEPLIVVKRVGNRRPQYSLCDVEYNAKFEEWHTSIGDAIFFGNKSKYWQFCESFADMRFDAQVALDSLIKPDVKRLYQLSIDGKLSTSIDGGKSWFCGGIMDYPKIPITQYSFEWLKETAHARWITLEHKATDNELLKGSLTKLKPPKPQPPTDFNDYAWFFEHLKKKKECEFDYFYSEPTGHENPNWKPFNEQERYFEVKEWRCNCYKEKVAEHEAKVKAYEKYIEEWNNL
jgi:hypothetical protein